MGVGGVFFGGVVVGIVVVVVGVGVGRHFGDEKVMGVDSRGVSLCMYVAVFWGGWELGAMGRERKKTGA